MKTLSRRWSLALAAAALALAPRAARADDDVSLVIDLDDGASDANVRGLEARENVTLRPNSAMAADDRLYLATVPRASAARVLDDLAHDPLVQAAEEDRELHALFVPNDPMFERQWGLQRLGVTRSSDITCGRGATVAVVDTGVACENHGDFSRIQDLAGTRCLPGWNFVNRTAHANDDQGHGTHVAGTIAQTTNNGYGTAGVAFCATILPVKVLDARGSGSLANVAEGIRWSADHGADVINLSLGGDGRSRVLEQAVDYAFRRGSTVVCAAGNNGRAVGSPANAPRALAVSAIDSGDQIAFFSSRGPQIAIAAPGVDILQQTICDRGRNRCEQFAAWSGTSMAAPHVAGAAALLYSLGVTDPGAVRALLERYSERPSHGGTERTLYGSGVVSAASSTQSVLASAGTVRVGVLAALALLLLVWVRRKQGSLTAGWLLPAAVTATGFFPLPRLAGHLVPGADFLMRPWLEWDLVLLGAHVHRWLPLANSFVALALVALGFSRRALRSPIGGVALGIAAYLVSELLRGTGWAPFGAIPYAAWIAFHVAVCLWIARIGIDRRTQ